MPRPALPPLFALALVGLAAVSARAAEEETSPAAVVLPDAATLRAQIRARDAELFDVLFLQCAPEKMRALLMPDLEFYHDKDGLILGADALVDGYAKSCRERQQPDAWRSRRELIEASLTVDPVPGVGAIQTGEHLFHERRGDGPETVAGRARFAQLWRSTPDGWRLSRVFSYAHGPADARGE